MLQILIKNNIRIRGASTPLRAAVTKALTIDNPAYTESKKKGRSTWGVDAKLKLYVEELGDIIAPRGFLKELKTILAQQGVVHPKVIEVRQNQGTVVNFGPWNPVYKLKDDQLPLVDVILKENGIAVAPAGSGKTIMGMRYILESGRATIWLTHTTDLMYQTKERAEATLQGVGRIGILGDGKRDYGDGKLIIATIQTLQANPDIIEALDQHIGVVVIDEAHHFPAPQFLDVAAKFTAAKMLGLTATPDRKDGLEKYMYMGIGPKLYEISRDGLYDSGRLVKPEVRFIFTKFKYEQASLREGSNVDAGGEDLDYTALLNALIHDEERTKLVAENILDGVQQAGPNGASLVITQSVRYCYFLKAAVEALAAERRIKVPSMAVVHGGLQRYTWRVVSSEKAALQLIELKIAVEHKYDKSARRWKAKVAQYTAQEFDNWQVTGKQRKEILEAVSNKEIEILFATQLAREGLDISHLSIGHMAMPKNGDSSGKRDGGAVEQEIGRIMRPNPADPNKKAIWYDYVDYEVGVFKAQYHGRRRVYKRLDLTVPVKKARNAEQDLLDSFLGMI